MQRELKGSCACFYSEYKRGSDRIFTCDGYFTVHFLQLGFYFRTTEEFNVLSLVLSCLWVFVWAILTCLSNFKLCVYLLFHVLKWAPVGHLPVLIRSQPVMKNL